MNEDAARNSVGVRDATPEDAEFLVDMLLESVNWAGEEVVNRRQLLRDRNLSAPVAGWQREGDLGVIAVDPSGPGGLQIPLGAAWLRQPPMLERTFTAADVPVVTVAVVPGQRGRLIEAGLLRSLVGRAADAGISQLLLNTAEGNPLRQIAEAVGFLPVRDQDGILTLMLNTLLARVPRPANAG